MYQLQLTKNYITSIVGRAYKKILSFPEHTIEFYSGTCACVARNEHQTGNR